MGVVVNRVLIALAALGLITCKPAVETPIPINVAVFNPPPVYQMWAQRAITCAYYLERTADSTAVFHVVHDSIDISKLIWIAVLTEDDDGGYRCKVARRCAGEFVKPDTIYISGQRLNEPDVIAHEALHWAVESPGEVNIHHGPPWGLCEFITPR